MHLCQKEMVFLGHIVSEESVSTDPAKVQVITSWPTPTKPEASSTIPQFVQLLLSLYPGLRYYGQATSSVD